MRELKGFQKTFVKIYLIVASIFHLYTAYFGILQPRLQRAVHLTFFLPIVFLIFPATKKSSKDKISPLDLILFFLSITVGMYIITNINRINLRFMYVSPVLPIEQILGLLNVVLIIEAVRRAVVPLMSILISFFVLYLFTCQYFPGIFYHDKFAFQRIIEFFYLLQDEGIYGSLTGISATYIAILIIFGAFINQIGTGDYFLKISNKIAGKAIGGPAKIAVISSGLFGSISGSATANVYTTGTFTIPLMIKIGYSRIFAAAVEAAASSGGQILPPVMAAGAFIMSDILGIPYTQIIIAAALPAIFYYASVFIMIHLKAVEIGIKPIKVEEKYSWFYFLKESYLLAPLVVLVYLLFIGYSPFTAAFYATIVTIFVGIINRKTQFFLKVILEALEDGARNTIVVAIAIAGAGIIISSLTNSGLGLAFSSIIISLSKGNILIALLLIMMTTLILGMGLPTSAAYIIAVSVASSALSQLGLDLLAAHLFVFYFAVFASLTPPVAITAYAAASLSKSDPMKTGYVALKLASAGFLVPYIFVYNKALLLQGPLLSILESIFFTSISLIILSISIIGQIKSNVRIPLSIRLLQLIFIPFLLFPLFNNLILIVVTRVAIISFLIILYYKCINRSKDLN